MHELKTSALRDLDCCCFIQIKTNCFIAGHLPTRSKLARPRCVSSYCSWAMATCVCEAARTQKSANNRLFGPASLPSQ